MTDFSDKLRQKEMAEEDTYFAKRYRKGIEAFKKAESELNCSDLVSRRPSASCALQFSNSFNISAT